MYDVIIIGGGPAGATLARLIGKDYKVLILEKRDFQENHEYNIGKACGGLVAPDAQLMLAKFGLGIPKSVLVTPQLFAVRVLDFDNSNERYYQRNYINIDREAFDRWLASLIPSEVKVVYNCMYKSYDHTKDGMTVKFIHNGKEYEERAKIIVGADGAFSKVRKQGFSNYPEPNLYITIQEWFKTDFNLDYHGAIFDREITDFYSWTIPKEDHLIVGSALKPNDNVHEKFQLLKEKLKDKGFKLENSVKIEGIHLYRPKNSNQICIGNDKIALIGEAAGFISPSSAEGLSYGFRSALALAKALREDFLGYHRLYSSYTKSLRWNIRMKNLKVPAMYNKNLRNFIMKTGLLSLKVEKL
ncbi:FAD-binding protein [Tissierella sp.]|uniref:FAD-binding protein n=1 Tax=Tissierella sp. TaxID=41274 RepID=UPI002856C575|nr:FAD-binding protein [Tissierella sp.]MDR7857817.1 FAD-binding protein [Tissierella sp.]